MTNLRGSGVKSVGKPDAGNRHVRFDERRGRETGLLAPRPSSTLPKPWPSRTVKMVSKKTGLEPTPKRPPSVPSSSTTNRHKQRSSEADPTILVLRFPSI